MSFTTGEDLSRVSGKVLLLFLVMYFAALLSFLINRFFAVPRIRVLNERLTLHKIINALTTFNTCEKFSTSQSLISHKEPVITKIDWFSLKYVKHKNLHKETRIFFYFGLIFKESSSYLRNETIS